MSGTYRPAYDSPLYHMSIRFFKTQAQLTSHIYLEIFNSQSLLEILEKLNEIVRDVLFRLRCGLSNGVSNADRLIYPTAMVNMGTSQSGIHIPEHVCHIHPR